jgi:hypothetical protein
LGRQQRRGAGHHKRKGAQQGSPHPGELATGRGGVGFQVWILCLIGQKIHDGLQPVRALGLGIAHRAASGPEHGEGENEFSPAATNSVFTGALQTLSDILNDLSHIYWRHANNIWLTLLEGRAPF